MAAKSAHAGEKTRFDLIFGHVASKLRSEAVDSAMSSSIRQCTMQIPGYTSASCRL